MRSCSARACSGSSSVRTSNGCRSSPVSRSCTNQTPARRKATSPPAVKKGALSNAAVRVIWIRPPSRSRSRTKTSPALTKTRRRRSRSQSPPAASTPARSRSETWTVLSLFQVDPVEVAGLLTLPLALEVDAAGVATPVRHLGLPAQPVGMAHDPFKGDVVLGPEGKGRQQQTRGQKDRERSNGQAATGTRSTRSLPGRWPLPDGWGPPPGTS